MTTLYILIAAIFLLLFATSQMWMVFFFLSLERRLSKLEIVAASLIQNSKNNVAGFKNEDN